MKKHLRIPTATAILFVIVGLLDWRSAQAQEQEPSATTSAPAVGQQPNVVKGFGVSSIAARKLLQANCTRCHIEPQPQDVNREYWPLVLHWMSHYAGYKGDEFPDIKVELLPEREALLPGQDYSYRYRMTDSTGRSNTNQIFKDFDLKMDSPPMTPADWALLRSYFVSRAVPLEFSRILRPKQPELKGFEASVPPLKLSAPGMVLSMAVDPARNRLYVGKTDGNWSAGGSQYAFDLRTNQLLGRLQQVVTTQDMHMLKNGIVRVSNHGRFPAITNDPTGNILDWVLEGRRSEAHLLVTGFSRLTQTHSTDLDADGLEDLVVTSFADGILEGGGGRGKLSVLWQTPQFAKLWKTATKESIASKGGLVETVLLPRAGMIGSVVGDFNNDGKPDIALLTAQAQQQVLLFVNKGNRQFEMHVIVEQTPSFGHIAIKAGDFNQDGKLDLVVLNGNNVEMVFPRPQHGIRVYENNGDLTFTERFEYPMHGASRAVVEDFDGDGDLDIAAIAIWPDWENAEPETFVYLENKGNWEFSPFSMASKDWGAWTDIASADVNGDQKPDIVLGYGAFARTGAMKSASQPLLQSREGKEPWVTYLINKH